MATEGGVVVVPRIGRYAQTAGSNLAEARRRGAKCADHQGPGALENPPRVSGPGWVTECELHPTVQALRPAAFQLGAHLRERFGSGHADCIEAHRTSKGEDVDLQLIPGLLHVAMLSRRRLWWPISRREPTPRSGAAAGPAQRRPASSWP